MYTHIKNNPVQLKKEFDKFERLERASLTVDEKLKYIRFRNEVYTHFRKYIYD